MLRLSDKVIVDPPVVLAPMAGITNVAFRRLCREYGARPVGPLAEAVGPAAPGPTVGARPMGPLAEAVGPAAPGPTVGARPGSAVGAGLYVSEMITSRALVERNPKTLRLVRFAADERPRSVQLYGVDPAVVGAAVRMIVEDDLADHVDLNFGCPVPKVTRKGGGAALPWRMGLFAAIVQAAVTAAAGAIPVTVKMRLGIDRAHLTYREAALRAQDAGVAHVALHGRTAADFYGGEADWAPIAELTATLDIPVLGNGDIWEADDALRMVRETGCAGVVIGRGCLGRPWLFADLAAAFAGRPERALPGLGEVAATMHRHAELLAEWLGEQHGVRDFRKHVAWYLKGFGVGGELRSALASAGTLAELDDLLGKLDSDQPFPHEVLGRPRGRTSGHRAVALPEGWLASRDECGVPDGAELPDSGG